MRFLIIVVLVLGNFILSASSSSSSFDTEDPLLENKVNENLPVNVPTYYEYEVVERAINKFLIGSPENIKNINFCLNMLFNKLPEQEKNKDLCFPRTSHPISFVNGGWRCRLKEVIIANKKQSPDDQKRVFSELLSWHLESFKNIAPRLGDTAKVWLTCAEKFREDAEGDC